MDRKKQAYKSKYMLTMRKHRVLEFLDFICLMSSQSSVYLTQQFIRRPPRTTAQESMLTMDWSSWLYPLIQLLGQLIMTRVAEHLIYPFKNGNQRGKGVNT